MKMKKWVVMMLICASAQAEEPFEKGAISDNRFLLILNTAYVMKRCRPAAEACLVELIGNGAHGRMQSGDTFGIWTFNNKLHAGDFPMQIWTPALNTTLARQAKEFLAKQSYDYKTHFETLAKPLAGVAQSSRALHIFLVTDGSEPVSGTPYDGVLNEAIAKNYKAVKSRGLPFVIVMGVEEGQFTGIKLNSTLNINIPEVARIPLKVAAPVAAGTTNAGTAAIATSQTNGLPAPTAPPVRPVPITTVDAQPATPIASPPAPPATPTVQTTPVPDRESKPIGNPAPEPAPGAALSTPSDAAQPVSAGSIGPPPQNSSAPFATQNLTQSSGNPTAPTSPPSIKAANHTTTAQSNAPGGPGMVTSVVVVAPASSENSMILLCAAFAFVFASGSLVWLIFFRRAADRPGPSLISRSIEKSKKDK